MQQNVDKVFSIAAPDVAAWQFLQQVEGVTSCIPGAEITEKTAEKQYKGKVKAKIGPATMSFNGDIEIKEINSDKHELHMVGSGRDTKGSSSAEMDLRVWVVAIEDGKSELHGKAKITINGKLASLGGRMFTQVADQILNQFGVNFGNHCIVIADQNAEAAVAAREDLAEQPKEINGLAFSWSVLIGVIKDWFKKKA